MTSFPETPGGDSPDSSRGVDERFLDALLQDVLRPDPIGDAFRLQRVIVALQDEVAHPTVSSSEDVSSRPAPRPSRTMHWTSLAVSAAVLFIAFLIRPAADSSSRALATVVRSRADALRPEVREYLMLEEFQSDGRATRDQARLFVSGAARFACEHPAPLFPGSLCWVGGNEEGVWMVPARGPVLLGDQGHLPKWFTEHRLSTTPLLQMSRMLSSLEERYELQELPDAFLDDGIGKGNPIRCRRILGRRLDERPLLPETIELWADERTDVAMRIELNWDPPLFSRGLRRVTFTLVDRPEVPEDWFEHGAHHAASRPVLEQESASAPADQF